LSVTLLGVPAGATLSAGSRQPDGSWQLAAADLPNLRLTPPHDFAGTLDLTLRATSTETSNGVSATTEHAFTVQVAGVMDGASLSASAAGREDTAIPIRAEFGTSSDSSEVWDTVAVIRGVPAGAVLSQGTDLGHGAWQVDRAELAAGHVAVTPPANSSAPISLRIEARLLDREDASASQLVSTTTTVQVTAVADAPAMQAAAAVGDEDTAIRLDLSAALTDTDGSEALSVTLLGVPAGATLSAG
ncbi:hypothetical protein, partial [Paracraurococcus lichenis]